MRKKTEKEEQRDQNVEDIGGEKLRKKKRNEGEEREDGEY